MRMPAPAPELSRKCCSNATLTARTTLGPPVYPQEDTLALLDQLITLQDAYQHLEAELYRVQQALAAALEAQDAQHGRQDNYPRPGSREIACVRVFLGGGGGDGGEAAPGMKMVQQGCARLGPSGPWDP